MLIALGNGRPARDTHCHVNGLRERIVQVERRLALRAVLRSGVAAAIGTAAIALAAALLAPSLPRLGLAVALVVGPLIGIVIGFIRARRARPSDAELVLWIDRRLEAGEAIVTAWELGADPPPLLRATVKRASELLASADRQLTAPRLGLAQLAWLAPASIFAAAIALVPVPPSRADDARVVVTDIEALTRIERLAEEERDPARRRHLEEAARRARELARELRRGVEREQAGEALESIRRELEAARRPETADERRARDAALEALRAEPEMQRALSERDPSALDRAVERAAARREAADRRRAQQSLTSAAEAARRAGDGELADSLLRRERLLRRRAEQAELARELADAMPELAGVRRALERLERQGEGAELSRAMVDAMREAWSRLTSEERARLAEALSRAQAAQNDEARAQREDAARELDADELERRLRQALENLDRLALGAAGRGGIPMPGAPGGAGGQGGGQGSSGQGGEGSDGQGGGVGRGGGAGPRGGETDRVAGGGGPLARVRPALGEGAPSETTFEWVDPEGAPLAPGLPEGAPVEGIAAGEAGAIERAPIPEDYREHVRTYFGGGGGESE